MSVIVITMPRTGKTGTFLKKLPPPLRQALLIAIIMALAYGTLIMVIFNAQS